MKKILLFLFFFSLSERFCYSQTDGFTPSKIRAIKSQEIYQIKDKTLESFYFLGSGKQFYVFVSEDGKSVIKFVKQTRRKPLPWLANLSLPKPLAHIRDSYLQKREKRLRELLESCRLALTELPQETGLIEAHLTPSSQKKHLVNLFDKLGISHTVDLEKTQFVVQKRASLLTTISQEAIKNTIDLTSTLAEKGVVNLDPMIKRNFGLCEGKVIAIDFGSFKKDVKIASYPYLQRSLFLQLLSLREHLQKNQPQDVTYFDEQIQKKLQVSI